MPPGELMKMTLRSFCESEASLAKSMNACGVPSSITPSATMTSGHFAPQSEESSLTARNVIGAWLAHAAAAPPIAPAAANASATTTRRHRRAAAARTPSAERGLVGGDGLEPPTLSV